MYPKIGFPTSKTKNDTTQENVDTNQLQQAIMQRKKKKSHNQWCKLIFFFFFNFGKVVFLVCSNPLIKPSIVLNMLKSKMKRIEYLPLRFSGEVLSCEFGLKFNDTLFIMHHVIELDICEFCKRKRKKTKSTERLKIQKKNKMT